MKDRDAEIAALRTELCRVENAIRNILSADGVEYGVAWKQFERFEGWRQVSDQYRQAVEAAEREQRDAD